MNRRYKLKRSILFILILLILSLVFLLIHTFMFNPIPEDGPYNFEIGGNYKQNDAINYMTFHFDYKKGEGFFSFRSNSINPEFQTIDIEIPPELKLKDYNILSENKFDVNVIDKSDEIKRRYIFEFSRPYNETISVLINLTGNIKPNGVYNFNTIPISHGWVIRLFLKNYDCQYSCITFRPENIVSFEELKSTGKEVVIKTEEENPHNIRFMIQTYNTTKKFWKDLFGNLWIGLLATVISSAMSIIVLGTRNKPT